MIRSGETNCIYLYPDFTMKACGKNKPEINQRSYSREMSRVPNVMQLQALCVFHSSLTLVVQFLMSF